MKPDSPSLNALAPVISNTSGDYYIASSSNIQHSSIQCSQSDCILICDTYQGCLDTSIDASNSTSLTIQCTSPWSCGLLSINKGPSNSASIQCVQPNACWNSDFVSNRTNTLYVTCDGDTACSSITIDTHNTNTITLSCNGPRACYRFNLHPHITQFLSITAKGSLALYDANIAANDTKWVSISCSSSHNVSACSQNVFQVPAYGKNVVLNCYGTGCYDMGEFNTIKDYRDTDVNINGCDACNSAADCVSNILLRCTNGSVDFNTYFYGASCSSTDCLCDDLSVSAARRFINDPLDAMCTYTTPAPTSTTPAPTTAGIVKHKDTILGIGIVYIIVAGAVIGVVLVMCCIVWSVFGPS
eukprot:392802_1